MKRASLALLVCVVLSVATGSAATKKSEPRRNRLADWSELSLQSGGLQSTWNNASGAVGNLTLSQGGDPGGVLILPPSTPDNWNGGASNWNNGGDWSAGVPGANSDVIIYSGGNNLVTLNVGSTTVSSLTLGGASNGTTSELTDGGLKQTLTITNALNVGQTGLLNLTGGSSVTAGADSSNAGTIYLDKGSALSDGGKFSNTGTISLFSGSSLSIAGDATNSNSMSTGGGAISISGSLTNKPGSDFFLYNSGDVAKVGTLNNGGYTYVGPGAALNLTNQMGGITNAVSGSQFQLWGSFNDVLGSANGFANLNSVEGSVSLYGQNITDTPGSGTLTISNGALTADYNPHSNLGTTLTINGNVNNSGFLATGYYSGGVSTLAINGTLTNNGQVYLYAGGDVANVGTLVNNGLLYIGTDATLNLSTQLNVTDIFSTYEIYGTFNAGPNNAFASLNSIEGTLYLANGQTTNITPGSGTLTNSGNFAIGNGTTVGITGDVVNNRYLTTDVYVGGSNDKLSISGTLTNNNQFYVGGSGDVANVGTLNNRGSTGVGPG